MSLQDEQPPLAKIVQYGEPPTGNRINMVLKKISKKHTKKEHSVFVTSTIVSGLTWLKSIRYSGSWYIESSLSLGMNTGLT